MEDFRDIWDLPLRIASVEDAHPSYVLEKACVATQIAKVMDIVNLNRY